MLLKSLESQPAVGMDMTPLIDMVFLLLSFFLVATTFHQAEREMQVALPIAQSAGPLTTALREIVVNIDAQGKLYVTGRLMSAEALRDLVHEALQANPQQKVTVRGDRQVAYGQVVTVLDICKAGGVQEPYLDTVLE